MIVPTDRILSTGMAYYMYILDACMNDLVSLVNP